MDISAKDIRRTIKLSKENSCKLLVVLNSSTQYISYDDSGISYFSIEILTNGTYDIKSRYGADATGAELADIILFIEGGTPSATITEISHYHFVNLIEFETKAASFDLIPAHFGKTIFVSDTATVTMPNGFELGWWCKIQRTGINTVTMAADGTLNSDGTLLETQWTSCLLVSTATNTWGAEGRLT